MYPSSSCGEGEPVSALLLTRLRSLSYTNKEGPVCLLRPLLTSSIGSSLRVLAVTCQDNEDLVLLAPMLAGLTSLEEFDFIPDNPDFLSTLVKTMFRSISPTVRSLTFRFLENAWVADLGSTLGDCLPQLEKLVLPFMKISTVEAARSLGRALMEPSVSNTLRSLYLDVSDHFVATGNDCWDLVEPMLALDVEDPSHDLYPSLESLILAGLEKWDKLGEQLLEGRFRNSLVVRSLDEETDNGNAYGHSEDSSQLRTCYECDPQTTRLWLKVLRERPSLQLFNTSILFNAARVNGNTGGEDELVRELFEGLSEPLDPQAMTRVEIVDIEVQEASCNALVKFIESGNLDYITFLGVGFRTMCSSACLTALGGALNRGLLACLTEFSIGIFKEWQESGGDSFGALKAFFECLSQGGMKNVTFLKIGNPYDDGPAEEIYNVLAEFPFVFSGISCLNIIRGVKTLVELQSMCKVLEAGAFPLLETLKFESKPATNKRHFCFSFDT